MSGPAPKMAEQRRRANAPARGEWVEIHRREGEIPPLPEGDWHPRAARSWGLWWSDPAASQWTDSQEGEVVELLALTDEFWRGNTTRANEMRLRADGLGLTQKGKRDLRWKVAEGEEPAAPAAPKAAADRRARLKVV